MIWIIPVIAAWFLIRLSVFVRDYPDWFDLFFYIGSFSYMCTVLFDKVYVIRNVFSVIRLIISYCPYPEVLVQIDRSLFFFILYNYRCKFRVVIIIRFTDCWWPVGILRRKRNDLIWRVFYFNDSSYSFFTEFRSGNKSVE